MKWLKIVLKMLGSWALLNLIAVGIDVTCYLLPLGYSYRDKPTDMKEEVIEGTLWSVGYSVSASFSSPWEKEKKQYVLEFKIPDDKFTEPKYKHTRTVQIYLENYDGFHLGDKRLLRVKYDANSSYGSFHSTEFADKK